MYVLVKILAIIYGFCGNKAQKPGKTTKRELANYEFTQVKKNPIQATTLGTKNLQIGQTQKFLKNYKN